ncbi:MAG TPA: hypothetical protein VLW75_07835 [Rhizomicrobium sp.]|nr:hypothetical protein [Rhizomicrobium sp.]
MPMILVTPLSAIEDMIRLYRPSHMITLLSPEHMIETPEGIEAARHLKLGLNDVSVIEESLDPPTERHVAELVEFGRGWNAKAPMLIHCWAGVSRSMAGAYTLLCDRFPGREREIAQAIRFRAPHAWPNALMVRYADAILQRKGRMVEAVEEIGRGLLVVEGECVELPLSLEEL